MPSGDSGYANGLVKLGRLNSGIDALNVRGSVETRIQPRPK